MEREETETANGFHDWEHLQSPPPSHRSLLSTRSSSSTDDPFESENALDNGAYNDNLSVFPPINHEGLPLLSQPSTNGHQYQQIKSASLPSDFHNNGAPPLRTPSFSISLLEKPAAQLVRWSNLALQVLNTKIVAVFSAVRSCGFVSSYHSLCSGAVSMAALLMALGAWVWWRRWRRRGREERIEHLRLLIKEKDEKILQLLDQIAQMNKVLLTRYRVPVLRSC